MKLSRLLRDVNGGDLCGKPEREITGICSDSRRVGQGSLFVAIPGFQSDGHQYIRQVCLFLRFTGPAGSCPWSPR